MNITAGMSSLSLNDEQQAELNLHFLRVRTGAFLRQICQSALIC